MAEQVDFLGLTKDDLILMNEIHSYPPRFHVRISGINATTFSNAEVKFKGCRENIDCNVMLQVSQRGRSANNIAAGFHPALNVWGLG